MSVKRFLYYLLKEDGRSGQVVNDVVTYSGQPKPLPQSPDGWQNLQLIFERSLDKHGLLTRASLPFGFVRNAARIIRDALYRETIETKLLLLIQRLTLVLTPTKYNWLYTYFFRGELDLSSVEDTRGMVNVPILEAGLVKLLSANEKTVYEFPMNDPVCVNVKMDGVALDKKGNYILVDGFEIDNTNYGDSSWAPFSLINSEGSAAGIAFFAQQIENTAGISFADRLKSLNFFAQVAGNAGSIDIHITGKIAYKCTDQDAANGLIMRFLKSSQTVGNQNDYILFTDSPLVSGTTYTHNIDITIPVTANLRVYLEMILGNTGVDTKIQFTEDSKLSVEYSFTYPTTYIKAYRRFDLYKKLIAKITGSEDNAISELCTEFDSLLISCGDAIRGIDAATLKTSFADFFGDCDSTLMAGQAVTPAGIELEDRLRYYQEIDEVDLGNVVDFVIKPATDLMNNTFKFGHQKQDIEDVNGKFGPNGNNQFSGPITKVVSDYNMVSDYKADPYEIETLRINLDGKNTTDDNSDSDVFVIAAIEQQPISISVTFSAALQGIVVTSAEGFVVGQKIRITGSVSNDGVYDIASIGSIIVAQIISFVQTVVNEGPVTVTIEWLAGGYYSLNRPAYTTLEGVPTATIFNLPYLTPKTIALRHGRWVRSMNAGLDTEKIKFVSGKDNKNTGLKTVLAGVTIDEDTDENLSGLGDYMFLPWYFIFKTEVPVNLPELLEINPNRSFIFTDERGQQWRGFLRAAGIAPNDYTPQEWKLLATPNNNIELLIHG